MIFETLLSAAIETSLGLLAEIGLGDEIRDLKERFTKSGERKRREAFEKAFAKAKDAVGEDVLTPLLDHRPFQEAVVNGLLDPVNGFDVQSAAEVWKDRFPEHARTLRRFFTTLENTLQADDIWGPILDRYEQQRFRHEVQEALRARNLDLSAGDVVRRVSVHLSGSGAIAMSGSAAAGAGGAAVVGNVSQIVLQQIVMQSGAGGSSGNLRQRYLTRLLNQCRALPLAALGGDAEPQKTVTLDQVFIDLSTTYQLPESTLEKIQHGEIVEWPQVGHDFTKWLQERSGEGEGRARRHEERPEDMRLLSALDALRLAPRLVLLGDPGAGKSSFARIVLARLAEADPPPGLSADLLPVLVVLRDVVPRLARIALDSLPGAKHDAVLADVIRDQMVADLAGLDSSGFADELVEALNAQHCLLVFDGLDEVPQDMRGLVRRAVLAAVDRYAPPCALVTCRTRSYVDDAMLPRFAPFTLAPFDEQQIEAFIHAWYGAQKELGRVDTVQAEHKATDLVRAALARDLRELASNPMLLTTMALIHQKEVGLPKERVRLYNKAVEVLLYRWQKEKVSQDALSEFLRDDRLLRKVMERLAYEAHLIKQSGQPGDAADLPRYQAQDLLEGYLGDANQAREFLNYIDQRAGLLVGRGGKPDRPAEYSFPHRTFQEYLAGCYLLTGSDGERVERFYAHASEGDRWNLVAQLGAEELFYNTRNGERQLLHLAYNLLIDQLTSEQGQRAVLWSGQMADLAGRQLIERDTGIPNGGHVYLQRLLPRLVTLLSSSLSAPERCVAGDILARLGDPRFRADAWYLPDEPLLGFVEIPEGQFVMGEKKETHTVTLSRYFIARYPVTVAQFGEFAKDRSLRELPNHPVVGVTWHDALKYCEWLTERLRVWEGTPEPLATLLKQEGWQVTLPSEAEWEKAARGENGWVYPWGDEFEPDKANTEETGIGGTSAVGCFPAGASQPYGVQDLSGNVWEWTRSLWGKDFGEPEFIYPYDPTDKRRERLDAPNDVARVLRGGAYWDNQGGARCAARLGGNPALGLNDVGFRVVVLPKL